MNIKRTAMVFTALVMLCGCGADRERNIDDTALQTVSQADVPEKAYPDNGREKVTRDTEIIRGIRGGMTADEVRTALGSPGQEADTDGGYAMKYGESYLLFEKMPVYKKDSRQRLYMVQVKDDSLVMGKVKIGDSKKSVLDRFCRETEDNTPAKYKEKKRRLIYGRADIDRLERDLENDADCEGSYRFATEYDDGRVIFMDLLAEGTDTVTLCMTVFKFEEEKLSEIQLLFSDRQTLMDDMME
ncbi:MAG: hypothetical protein J6F31_02540 [Oscillospiraceae bacterium]|nr:hypothetical protein [Oscillospiraceae bacterium]